MMMMMSAFCSYNCEKFCSVFANFALVAISTRNMREFKSAYAFISKPNFIGKHTNILLSISHYHSKSIEIVC